MIDRIPRPDAVKVDAFNDVLTEFADYAVAGSVIGSVEYGGADWVWVKHLGNRYYLNADTTLEGVRNYLALLDKHGPRLTWSVVENARGRRNKVAFGTGAEVIEGFYFYRADT
jgi:hypothetical protein